eukprot:CAMPEP_0178406014 /NCGR_PEP_ID=MMETSP0689_2-20121128/18695_1 /TAXON_ID=160604 /ORGANISM="Amphidinium massartii, Strain CS-259" /LENGTH=339 /DNA_ID=CAMNT_0020027045 /DNA_START=130 /DNA_END=1149 /DNA_ORIENTATION=+
MAHSKIFLFNFGLLMGLWVSSVGAFKPKHAEVAQSVIGLHSQVGSLDKDGVHHGSNASGRIALVDKMKSTTRKVDADFAMCKQKATDLRDTSSYDWTDPTTYQALQTKIANLKGEGNRRRRSQHWVKIDEELEKLKNRATAVNQALDQITQLQGLPHDQGLADATPLARQVIESHASVYGRDTTSLTVPMNVIAGVAAETKTQAFDKFKYAKHFKSFWNHVNEPAPVLVLGDFTSGAVTPRTVLNDIITPMIGLKIDTAPSDVGGASAELKYFLEYCTPHNDNYRYDPLDDEDLSMDLIYGEVLAPPEYGEYLEDLEQGFSALSPVDFLRGGAWTAVRP